MIASSPSVIDYFYDLTTTVVPTLPPSTSKAAKFKSIYLTVAKSIQQGLNVYSKNYLKGIATDNTNSSKKEIQIQLDLFIATLINETELLIGNNRLNLHSVNFTDSNLSEKVVHLTENLMILITIQFDAFMKNTTNENINYLLVEAIQSVIAGVLINFEKNAGFSQNEFANKINKLISKSLANSIYRLILQWNITEPKDLFSEFLLIMNRILSIIVKSLDDSPSSTSSEGSLFIKLFARFIRF